ncbi:hypothetical protein V6N11_073467 [Hibiscus sabdariffa]|uniref:Uncharacterized protein n=2 Tax=Hibiscus sabdariffa TaxID=183260 RepID=A0ABR2NTE9_9ROSI
MLPVVPPTVSSSTNDHLEFVDAKHDFSFECTNGNQQEIVPQGDSSNAEPAIVLPEEGDAADHVYEDASNDFAQQVQADYVSNSNDDPDMMMEGLASQVSHLQEEERVASTPNIAQSVGTNSTPDLLLNNGANDGANERVAAGDMLHHVRVIELGFNDNSVELNRGKKMVNPEEDKEKQRVDNDLESTSDPSEKMAPTVSPDGEGSERRSVEKDGSFNETCFGNDYGEKAQYQ